MIQVGCRAPTFRLPGDSPVGASRYRLTDLTAEGSVLLAFLPLGQRPDRALRTALDLSWLQFDAVTTAVVADAGRHATHRFAADLPPGVPILSDDHRRVAAAYGVSEDAALVLVDDSQVVQRTWDLQESTDVDVAAVREAAAASAPRQVDHTHP
ncbi:MAG: hypothetical protein ABEJ70_05905 [Halobacteriaceae archaeon]